MSIYKTIFLFIFSLKAFAGATQWTNFELERGHIKVPATVSGIPSKAILDTGAQLNGINSSFINKHGLELNTGQKVMIQGVYGTERRSTYNNVSVNVFGIDLQLDRIAEVNLGYHHNAMLFGAVFFQNFITQLDYPNKRIRFITHDAIKLNELENIKTRKQKGTGLPIVEVELGEGKSVWLLLDTGSSGGIVIERKVARALGWLDSTARESGVSRGVNQFAHTESFRAPWLRFGPFELENVLINIPAEGQSANLTSQYETTGTRIRGKKVQGLIGYDVLKHFVITIDYRNGHAHIALPED